MLASLEGISEPSDCWRLVWRAPGARWWEPGSRSQAAKPVLVRRRFDERCGPSELTVLQYRDAPRREGWGHPASGWGLPLGPACGARKS
jgi:hypothetical protein